MDQTEKIAALKLELELLTKKNTALAKSNRNWRRKCQKLRSAKTSMAQTTGKARLCQAKEVHTERREKCSMNYFISDLHLCCKNQTQAGANYDGRPFANTDEMNEHILRSWNQKVTNADTVYILGDVGLRGKNDDLVSLVARMNGKKVLVFGNHDDVQDYRYRILFHDICHYKELTENFNGQAYKVAICHYPILMWSGQHRGTILLYGHTHQSVEDDFFQECIQKMNENEELSLRRRGGQKIRAINVGCMQPWMDYEPRTLKEILTGYEEYKK